jgi:hypothetical protein
MHCLPLKIWCSDAIKIHFRYYIWLHCSLYGRLFVVIKGRRLIITSLTLLARVRTRIKIFSDIYPSTVLNPVFISIVSSHHDMNSRGSSLLGVCLTDLKFERLRGHYQRLVTFPGNSVLLRRKIFGSHNKSANCWKWHSKMQKINLLTCR